MEKTKLIRGADAIINALREEGVTFIAGITGASMFEMFDALDGVPEIKTIVARHERCAVDIAGGFARVTGKPGVAMSVQGPGGANAFAGIANAFADSLPVLLLQGMVHQHNVDRGALQNTDMMFAYTNVVRWKSEITNVERVPEMMRRAFSILTATRPRPVVLGVPSNVAAATIESDKMAYEPIKQRHLYFRPAHDDVERAAQVLLSAHQPLIYAGAGVLWANASDELKELAELLGAPVMTTALGKSAISERHPLSLRVGGFPVSTYAHKAALEIFPRADVVLAIGASFKQMATRYLPVPSKPKLVQIDADPTEFNKHYPAEVALLGDARSTLKDLIAAVKEHLKRPRDWKEIATEIAELHKEEDAYWHPFLTSNKVPISPHRLIYELMQVINPNDVILLNDSGSSRGFVIHHWVATNPGGVLAFGGQSSLGWSMGACIGAKLGAPDKHVINLMGDGAFGMTGMELNTAVRHGIKTITIVINNDVFGLSMGGATRILGHQPQTWQSFKLSGDYATIAKGMGATGLRVERPEEIRGALEKALKAEGPVLIDVKSDAFVKDVTLVGGAKSV